MFFLLMTHIGIGIRFFHDQRNIPSSIIILKYDNRLALETSMFFGYFGPTFNVKLCDIARSYRVIPSGRRPENCNPELVYIDVYDCT